MVKSMSIRVLAVVRCLNRGGLENRLMDILRNIDHQRIEIDIFTCQHEPGVFDDEVKALGGKVFYNPSLNIGNMLWYVQFFNNFLRTHREYKIVHAHQDAWCSVFCKGAYLADVPIRIAHSRTSFSSDNLEHIVKNIIKLSTKKYANYYFAVSGKSGRWLYGDKLYEQGKVQIWPNAIDAKKFYYDCKIRERVRAANNWDGKYVVMHVGNFTPPKNHPFILAVFNEIHKIDAETILVLVGMGDRRFVDRFIKEHDLNQSVQILGSRADVSELLQGADVFLFPSIFEGLPGAMVEAQAAGLPCVMSDTIAEEIQITPNLTIKSLLESHQSWAESTLKYKNFERMDMQKYIEEKGFDVRLLTNKLCLFYEEAHDKGDSKNEFV